MNLKLWAAIFIFGGCLVLPTDSFGAKRHHAKVSPHTAVFDYYLLNLSWAPEFCHSQPNNPECSGHFGFIVHGLWPQLQNGSYPENCSQAPGLSDPSKMLDLMPDPHLIQHEWQTHGTCSGLSADEYFGLIRKIYQSVKLPKEFVGTPRQFSVSPDDVKSHFVAANPGFSETGIEVTCSGQYFVALELCLTKDGKPTQCGGGLRSCRAPTVRVPKVQ